MLSREGQARYRDIVTCFRMLRAESGGSTLSLFKGALTRLLATGPLLAITLFSFETLKDLMQRHLPYEGVPI